MCDILKSVEIELEQKDIYLLNKYNRGIDHDSIYLSNYFDIIQKTNDISAKLKKKGTSSTSS